MTRDRPPFALTGGGGGLGQRLPVSAKDGVGSERRKLAQLRTGVVVAFGAGARDLDKIRPADEAADGDVSSCRKGFELRTEGGRTPEVTQRLEVAVGGTGKSSIGGRGDERLTQLGKQLGRIGGIDSEEGELRAVG